MGATSKVELEFKKTTPEAMEAVRLQIEAEKRRLKRANLLAMVLTLLIIAIVFIYVLTIVKN